MSIWGQSIAVQIINNKGYYQLASLSGPENTYQDLTSEWLFAYRMHLHTYMQAFGSCYFNSVCENLDVISMSYCLLSGWNEKLIVINLVTNSGIAK